MKFISTKIPELIRIQPRVFSDERGYFMESYQKLLYTNAGIPHDFVQDNQSSSKKSVLRGLHYQVTHTQGKLVRVLVGEIFDIAVDLRKSSPHFGDWVGVYLTDENKEQLWVPPGFAHGFYTLSDRADVLYKTTDYFDPQGERCIRWDDPDLAIDWPIPDGESPLVSDKDKNGSYFINAEVFA